MTSVIPENFPDTGINHVARDGVAYEPAEWPEAVDFVRDYIRFAREMAIGSIEPVALSERQRHAMHELALPAIADTVSDILGASERLSMPGAAYVSLLTGEDFAAYSGRPVGAVAGTYYSARNQILINQANHSTDSAEDLAYFIKVFVHEDFHFLSDQFSSLERGSRHLQIQRVGVHTLGEDIREKKRGELTWDYFLSFNEAITEMLAIEAYEKIAQNVVFIDRDGNTAIPFKAYPEYRNLANTVMEDAIRYGATDLSKRNLWRYIARANLTGDMRSLMELVRATYPGLSMREFGLITKASELPQESDFVWQPAGPDGGGGPTLSEEYLTRLRDTLNGKPASDYVSDVAPPPTGPPPPPSPLSSPAAVSFLREISQHRQDMVRVIDLSPTLDGRFTDRSGALVQQDENGNNVHYDQTWLPDTLELLIDVSKQFRSGAISVEEAGAIMDQWLFSERRISELSYGFEEFYAVKHVLLDLSTSDEDFHKLIEDSKQKLAALRGNS